MKKILSSLFISILLVFGLSFANTPNLSGVKNSANAETSDYDVKVLATISDNENLSALNAETIELGTSFNVVDHVNLEVYDQNPYGSCYATSLAQVLNLCYEYQTKEHIRLSAIALALQIEDLFFDYGSNNFKIIENSYNLSYVSEFDFPYELANTYNAELNTSASKLALDFEDKEIVDVKEYYSFPRTSDVNMTSVEVQEQYLTLLKKALKKQGALAVGLEYKVAISGENYVFHRGTTSHGGHAMVIVGYDDTFAASNFGTGYETDGAFLILNSWGVNQEIIYMSYEDYTWLNYIFGIGGFIDPDERADEVSNIEIAHTSVINLMQSATYAEDLEFGYQISNTSSNNFLSQIDLQSTGLSNSSRFYSESYDVEIYLNPTSNSISGATEFLGEFDINAGTNKIKLSQQIAVAENFALRFVVKDTKFSYGFFDESSQNFVALYKNGENWVSKHMTNDNYNMVRTPFYLRTILTEESTFEISEEQNYQTATTNTVEFDVSSSEEITRVDVEIYKHDTVTASLFGVEISQILANDLFNLNVTTSKVSITPKNFVQGTFKVVISINGGEKEFIKFLFFDDAIGLITFNIDPTLLTTGTAEYYRLYSNTFESNTINITLPSSYYLTYTVGSGTRLNLATSFDYDADNVTASPSYSNDTDSRIAKATIVFTHNTLGTTRTLKINFTYEDTNRIVYVTALPTATHLNSETLTTGVTYTLKDASAPNHNFLGWYESPDFSGKAVASIKFNSDGNIKTFYARFEQKPATEFVKSVSYDKNTKLMTISLDFSQYSLGLYDTVEFSNIVYNFATTRNAHSFIIGKTSTYDYKIYVPQSDLGTINNVRFNVKIKRENFYENAVVVEDLSKIYANIYSNPMWKENSILESSVDVNDVVSVSLSISGNGTVKNALNGEILTSGTHYVSYGGTFAFRMVPNNKHYTASIKVNGSYVTVQEIYTLSKLTSNATVEVVFRLKTYEISMIVNGIGTINHGNTENVEEGGQITYTFEPSTGYYLKSIIIDGVTYTGKNSYTFYNVCEDHQITVNFELYQYIVTAVIVGNGTIGQATKTHVRHGDNLTFNFVAGEGYSLKQILVDGTPVEVANSYILENITKDCEVRVVFEKDIINVRVEIVGTGSVVVRNLQTTEIVETLTQSEDFVVNNGIDLKFEFVTEPTQQVGEVYINGYPVAIADIERENVIDDVTIKVVFKTKTFNLKVSCDGNGTTNQLPNITRIFGESITYTFVPNQGYSIKSVIVNGESLGAISEFKIESIEKDYVISVSFEIKTYQIKWYNYNNVLLGTSSVKFMVVPAAPFAAPTRPNEGIYTYEFAGWNTKADGTGSGITNATADVSYYAIFSESLVKYEIKSSVKGNGTISPSGVVMAEHGSNQTFVFEAEAGYHLSKVFVDGVAVDFVTEYTFTNITSAHQISATFRKNDYKIEFINSENKGEILGSSWLETGERAMFKIVPKEGYKVSKVFVDGSLVSVKDNVFIIESVRANMAVEIVYESDENAIISFVKNNLVLVAGGVVVLVIGAVIIAKVAGSKKKGKYNYDSVR